MSCIRWMEGAIEIKVIIIAIVIEIIMTIKGTAIQIITDAGVTFTVTST